ncbi:dephospho-CoA kinase [Dinoroseobacter shibae DFL 12 = DSM 16493]|jgi:dephospho-CoA kinase|uniref:Dephospho-CoA kinase n=1 Tax=Dinoroseobacter shibae (strain DSM 16493 / NCIMB 14021 / DFL 12) TaxID=398580 RepID=A8LPB7_DINSH|nr:dephospho-CoA kinase [Dinoroseobacter shibae]ABV95182.1 dephospho-CoA kinase [Dinoroseobacter shibae DFL 12 = DSM 16493]URF46595.1 dephospho-CoA kinase [Dinoroseobacter shibae]URF50901.1 dephospho-CoA kinase [Dinoroseobacter shibae]
MIIIGLTGSIGMGKSTTAEMFAARGLPVWDADAAVHRLYGPKGAAIAPIRALFSEAVSEAGVDRTVLKRLISEDPDVLRVIEQVVHPLVAADRTAFVDQARLEGRKAVLLDIPLLFETGAAKDMDLVVVVSTDPDTQRARVLERPGMTEAQFQAILAKQLADAEKRTRADLVIDTTTLDTARQGVETVLQRAEEMGHA